MRSGDSARRFWATFLLTELPYSAAVAPLIPRLYDADTKVRMVARAAARTLAETANETLLAELARALRDSQTSRSARLGILEALGELREPLCVPVLIQHLSDSDAEVQMAARRSLIAVTRQDFALETKPWLAWWGQNSQRHRIEWLIDALEGETPALRKAASDELRALTKQTFCYYDDLPRRERERVQQKFRDWWASEGKSRFVRG
jgi:HEAT repeat protein